MKEFDNIVARDGLEALWGAFPHIAPFTLSDVRSVWLKADGSIMSTYVHQNELRLKSRGSIQSEHCHHAMEWLAKPDNTVLLMELRNYALAGYTVNLEWCAPQHRIVVGYPKAHLIVLGARETATGADVDIAQLIEENNCGAMRAALIEKITDDPTAAIEKLETTTGIEGYVFMLNNGVRVKRKTPWYSNLHRVKSNYQHPRGLFEAAVTESLDDAVALFADDEVFRLQSELVMAHVRTCLNLLEIRVNVVYHTYKGLDRKHYAIAARAADVEVFGLCMNMYLGKEISYKDFLMKNYDAYKVPL